MPNHVTSELRVDGAPDEVRRFFEAIDGGIDENGDPLLILTRYCQCPKA